jgi:hypothetical protein
MNRTSVTKRLAALPSQPKRRETDQLFELLRSFALRHQRDQPQVFHPIREMASHFGVPVSTVARLYRRLEAEGILVSVRGARTLLQGLSSERRLSVRGVIGLPVFMPWFLTLQEYRTFFLRMRRELRARGFAVSNVFYNGAELHDHERLAARIERHKFDTVLWHQPDRIARTVAAQLNDCAVRVLGVSDRGFPSIRCRYEVQRERALVAIFAAWQHESSISSVVLMRGCGTSAAKEELLKHLLNEAGLVHRCEEAAGEQTRELLDSLGKDSREAIVLPCSAAALCAFRAPEALGRLMQRTRVALTGGAVSIPFASIPDALADIVVVDWQLVAEQIVSDLLSSKAFAHGETTVFEATAQLRVPMRQFAHSL